MRILSDAVTVMEFFPKPGYRAPSGMKLPCMARHSYIRVNDWVWILQAHFFISQEKCSYEIKNYFTGKVLL